MSIEIGMLIVIVVLSLIADFLPASYALVKRILTLSEYLSYVVLALIALILLLSGTLVTGMKYINQSPPHTPLIKGMFATTPSLAKNFSAIIIFFYIIAYFKIIQLMCWLTKDKKDKQTTVKSLNNIDEDCDNNSWG